MVSRKPDRSRVIRNVVETQCLRFSDQDSEESATPRKVADRGVRLVIDPSRHEPLEPLARHVDHPERRIPGAGQARRSLREKLKERVEGQLGAERDARVDQHAQTIELCGRAIHVSHPALSASRHQRVCDGGPTWPDRAQSIDVRSTAGIGRRLRGLRGSLATDGSDDGGLTPTSTPGEPIAAALLPCRAARRCSRAASSSRRRWCRRSRRWCGR